MNTKKSKNPLLCFLVLVGLILPNCAPIISRETIKKVDHGLHFEQILKNPDNYRGRIVLLGGDIIETRNFPGKTLIIVLQHPLTFRNKPVDMDISQGRFIVSSPGFLDPAIYRPGRKITVAGSVLGKEVLQLDEIDYEYPVIAKKELYLWPLEEYSDTEPGVRIGIGIGVGISF